MIARRRLTVGALIWVLAGTSQAEIRISAEHRPDESDFAFKSVPAPVRNDAATAAEFTLLQGECDGNSPGLAVLHDGRLPTEEDQPAANFFFRAGTGGGRLRIDLGQVIAVKQVNSYSWHPGTRAPQVYRLYAADGEADGFNASPGKATSPDACGWKHLASVDTRPEDRDAGGQHGVSVFDPASGGLGRFRYLLFDISQTEARDAFGNTFFSEIDVLDADGPAGVAASTGDGERRVRSFEAEGGKYRFTLDVTAAPDLSAWADVKLRPVVEEWYPKLVAMLPSDGFQPATHLTFRFRDDLGGTPASASGRRVNLNSDWFRRELDGEALGSVVHEMVHVVQDYGRARPGTANPARTPGWIVEGLADYIRWFVFEPEKRGAEITDQNLAQAKYDASYRITANFLNWVTQHRDPEIVSRLNAAAREGRYAESLWKERTGQTLAELGEQWRKTQEERIQRGHQP